MNIELSKIEIELLEQILCNHGNEQGYVLQDLAKSGEDVEDQLKYIKDVSKLHSKFGNLIKGE